jgi:hypothetical protein
MIDFTLLCEHEVLAIYFLFIDSRIKDVFTPYNFLLMFNLSICYLRNLAYRTF